MSGGVGVQNTVLTMIPSVVWATTDGDKSLKEVKLMVETLIIVFIILISKWWYRIRQLA